MALSSLTLPSTSTVDTNGNCTIRFPAPSLGQGWAVTVSAPGSPAVGWTISVAGFVYGIFAGGTPFGPLNLFSPQVVTLTATGLVAGTQLTGALVGAQGPASEIQLAAPLPSTPPGFAAPVPSLSSRVNGSGATIVAAPPAGMANYIWVCEAYNDTGTQSNVFFADEAGSRVIAEGELVGGSATPTGQMNYQKVFPIGFRSITALTVTGVYSFANVQYAIGF